MSPHEIEAMAQRIVASAALADGEVEGEPDVGSDALEAALAVEAAIREVSGGTPPADRPAAPSEPDSASDAAWFAAHPERSARLRPHQPGDPRPWWAGEGQRLMSVVRYFPTLRTSAVEALPADAFGGAPMGESDADVLAAARLARLSAG